MGLTMGVTLMVLINLVTHADQMADAANIDRSIFRAQINMESGWNPNAVSWAGAEGIAQIIPKYHPDMEGKTFDPYASLEYAAHLMASHIAYRGGDVREALADYNTGRNSSGSFRAQGYAYADKILEAAGVRQSSEVELLREDSARNHALKLAALHHLGQTVQVLNRIPQEHFYSDDDRLIHKDAEVFYHTPEG